jgi:hypothetical protein
MNAIENKMKIKCFFLTLSSSENALLYIDVKNKVKLINTNVKNCMNIDSTYQVKFLFVKLKNGCNKKLGKELYSS